MTRLLIRSLYCSVACVAALSTSPVQAETLNDAVVSALNYHPTVEAALAKRGALQAQEWEEWSAYFPRLNVNGTAGRVFGDNSTSRGLSITRDEGYSWLWEGSVSANQLIFDAYGTQHKIDAVKAREEAEAETIMDIRERLASQAVMSYLDVMRARVARDLVRSFDETTRHYLGRIRILVHDGAADETELTEAENVRLMVERMLADYEGQVLSGTAVYEEVTGHMPDADLEKPQPHVASIPTYASDAIAYAKQFHPRVEAAERTTRAESMDIEADTAMLYPTVNGELSYYKKDYEDILGGEVDDGRMIVRMNWDFSTGGAELARIQRSKMEYNESLSKKNEIGRQLEKGVRQAYANMETAKRQYALAKENVALNKKLLSTYKTQFEGGKASLLQILQTENRVLNTKLEEINAEYRLIMAQFGALASMGRLQDSLNILPAAEKDEQEPELEQQFADKDMTDDPVDGIEPACGDEESDVAPVSEPELETEAAVDIMTEPEPEPAPVPVPEIAAEPETGLDTGLESSPEAEADVEADVVLEPAPEDAETVPPAMDVDSGDDTKPATE